MTTSITSSLDQQRSEWVEAAWSQLSRDSIRDLNRDLVDLHSPMGDERALAEWLVGRMRDSGISSSLQPIDARSANAVGRYGSASDGPSLLLYAPIDTHIAADEEVDLPWVGRGLRDDMRPSGYLNEIGDVVGLGASNPKALVAAQLAALEAVVRAGVPLRGEVVAAFCGGGMPYHSEPGYPRQGVGMGSGVFHLVTHGVTADFGLICKPGYQVTWEEAGLAWFKITTSGPLMYAGLPHDMPGYRNAIADIGQVAVALESWLPEYAKANSSGLVEPQGALGAIRGGHPSRTAIPTASAELYVDLRLTPRMTPLDAQRQLEKQIDILRAADPGLDVTVEMIAAYPSASTDRDHWIVRSTTRAWEAVEGREHPAEPDPSSGQTDASLIRNLGIPLARVGCPWNEKTPAEWSAGIGGMGVSHIPDVEKVARIVVHTIIDSCTRARDDLLVGGTS